jgi:hypothetical protein
MLTLAFVLTFKHPWPQVPVLFDKKTQTIVNNESSQILRMFETEFATLGKRKLDLYPVSLRDEIDELNAWIYQVRTHLSASPAPSHTQIRARTYSHMHTMHARAYAYTHYSATPSLSTRTLLREICTDRAADTGILHVIY